MLLFLKDSVSIKRRKRKLKEKEKFGSQSSQETQRYEPNNNTHQPTVLDNFFEHHWQSYDDSDSSTQVSGIGEEIQII